MAANRKGSGARYSVASASADIASGNPCVQENFFGIAMDTVLSGSTELTLAIEGIWNIAVPASTVRGDFLYVPSSAGGVLLTEDADVTAELTRTSSNANAPVCIAMTDRDAAGKADVLILPRGASRAGTQV